MKSIRLLAALLVPLSLSATGFKNYEVGPRATALAGAFVAGFSDPASIFYNPAAITGLEGTQFHLGGSFTSRSYSFSSPDFGGLAFDSERASFPLPSFAVTRRINRFLWAGLGFHAASSHEIAWPADRFNPLVYDARRLSFRAWRLTPALAVLGFGGVRALHALDVAPAQPGQGVEIGHERSEVIQDEPPLTEVPAVGDIEIATPIREPSGQIDHEGFALAAADEIRVAGAILGKKGRMHASPDDRRAERPEGFDQGFRPRRAPGHGADADEAGTPAGLPEAIGGERGRPAAQGRGQDDPGPMSRALEDRRDASQADGPVVVVGADERDPHRDVLGVSAGPGDPADQRPSHPASLAHRCQAA